MASSRYRNVLLTCIVAGAMITTAACASDDPADSGSELTISVTAEALTLDPHAPVAEGGSGGTIGATAIIVGGVYESLIEKEADDNIVPGLAIDLPEQIDETTWRFQLREGVEFTNGEPVNADAVVYSVERLIDPELGTSLESFIEGVSGAQAVDEYTVDVTTAEPDPRALDRFTWISIVPPEASTEPEFNREPVGTGPYVLESASASEYRLESNPDYWGDEPPIENVNIRVITDPSTTLAGLETGEIDLADRIPVTLANSVPRVVTLEGSLSTMVLLDTLNGITTDVRVRQALNYAVDKQAMADQLYEGYASVNQCQIATPTVEGHNESLEPYPYDPDLATQLLEEAGATGQTIELLTSNQNSAASEKLSVIASYWEAVGLDVIVSVVEREIYIDLLTQGQSHEGIAFYSESSQEADSARAIGQWFTFPGNLTAFNNSTINELYEQIVVNQDPEERTQQLDEALQIICEQAPAVFLVDSQDIYGLASERIEFQPRADGIILAQEISIS